jgi:FixJ family two-component response regulator
MAKTSPWIAIVDDDPAVLKGLSRLLRSRGFHVETYGSGREFLAALPVGRPECVIVDLQMPDMNGGTLQQQLVNSGITIPTILLTADGDAVLHEQGEGGFVGSLRKPVLEKCLFEAIDKAIGSAEAAGHPAARSDHRTA